MVRDVVVLDIIIGTITMAAMMASIPMEERILEESSRGGDPEQPQHNEVADNAYSQHRSA